MNPFEVNGFQVEGFCQKDTFYVRMDKEDIQCLLDYAKDMNYLLDDISEINPLTIKIVKGERYGWIRKVIRFVDQNIEETYIYGFFRKGKFYPKYPITFNIRDSFRKIMTRKFVNFDDDHYPNPCKLIYGIIDLEPQWTT